MTAERNRALDKSVTPPQGYNWVPASADACCFDFKVNFRRRLPTEPIGYSLDDSNKYKVYRWAGPYRVMHATNGPNDLIENLGGPITRLGYDAYKSNRFALYGADAAPLRKNSHMRDRIRAACYVIQDSGGFQLATGVTDFLDPKHVAKCHSVYADMGVTLDLPGTQINDPDLLAATARVLVANTKEIANNVDSAVKLMNVCHGKTLALRAAYIKEIRKGPPLDGLCIGGLRQSATSKVPKTPLEFTAHVMLAILMTERQYHYYHVLGVSAPWQMAILAHIANVTQKAITSDSASHIFCAKSGLVFGYLGKITHSIGAADESDFTRLGCSCAACNAAEYEWPMRISKLLRTAHNLHHLIRDARTFQGLATGGLPAKEFRDLMVRHGQPDDHVIFDRALKLVNSAKTPNDLQGVPETSLERSRSMFGGAKVHTAMEHRIEQLVHKYEKHHGKTFL